MVFGLNYLDLISTTWMHNIQGVLVVKFKMHIYLICSYTHASIFNQVTLDVSLRLMHGFSSKSVDVY